jgi:hypothetical protein
MSREADIQAALSLIDPDVRVHAIPDADGCRIVVEINGHTHWLSVGHGRSALVNYLLTGCLT